MSDQYKKIPDGNKIQRELQLSLDRCLSERSSDINDDNMGLSSSIYVSTMCNDHLDHSFTERATDGYNDTVNVNEEDNKNLKQAGKHIWHHVSKDDCETLALDNLDIGTQSTEVEQFKSDKCTETLNILSKKSPSIINDVCPTLHHSSKTTLMQSVNNACDQSGDFSFDHSIYDNNDQRYPGLSSETNTIPFDQRLPEHSDQEDLDDDDDSSKFFHSQPYRKHGYNIHLMEANDHFQRQNRRDESARPHERRQRDNRFEQNIKKSPSSQQKSIRDQSSANFQEYSSRHRQPNTTNVQPNFKHIKNEPYYIERYKKYETAILREPFDLWTSRFIPNRVRNFVLKGRRTQFLPLPNHPSVEKNSRKRLAQK